MVQNKKDTQHSIYYNDDAHTVLKKYRLRRRVILLIYILGTLVNLFFLFTKVLINQEYIWFLCFPLWLIFRGVCLLLAQLQFTPVVNIFYKDCDPEKFYEVISMFKMFKSRGKDKDNHTLMMLYKSLCCYYIPERQAEGLDIIKEIHFIKPTPVGEQMRLLCSAYYAKDTQDKEWFARIKSEFENLPNLYSFRKGSIRMLKEYGLRLRLTELMWDFPENFTQENAKEARILLNKLLSCSNNALREVVYHFNLAKLDIAAREYQNAKPHLQYVVFYAGQLPLKAEADIMLKECEQFI